MSDARSKGCLQLHFKIWLHDAVEVDSGNVSLTGRISSISSEANTRNEAVVRASLPFHPAMDSADDGYEKCFSVDNIHLLKEQEAQLLQDAGNAQNWFGSIYIDAHK